MNDEELKGLMKSKSPIHHLCTWSNEESLLYLLKSEKVRCKEKTYMWVSLWCKTKSQNWGIYTNLFWLWHYEQQTSEEGEEHFVVYRCLLLIVKRKSSIELIQEYRCYERLKGKTEGIRRLGYIGFRGEQEFLKIKTRSKDEKFESVSGECVI